MSGLPARGVLQVEQWRAAGKEPYAYSFQRTHLAAQLQAQYADLPAGEARTRLLCRPLSLSASVARGSAVMRTGLRELRECDCMY